MTLGGINTYNAIITTWNISERIPWGKKSFPEKGVPVSPSQICSACPSQPSLVLLETGAGQQALCPACFKVQAQDPGLIPKQLPPGASCAGLGCDRPPLADVTNAAGWTIHLCGHCLARHASRY